MNYFDYIIASHRVRISGLDSSLSEMGLDGFTPFYVGGNSSDSECGQVDGSVEEDENRPLVEIIVGRELQYQADSFHELTRFDFDAGDALCIFYSSDTEYLFVMQSQDGTSQRYICSKNGDVVLSDAQTSPQALARSLFRFGVWFMVGIAMARKGCCAIHSSVIVVDGKAVMFLGESGTGKSTHTRLWREHIAGAELLNDDSPFVGVADGCVTVYGSPWSGKTPCYRNISYPLHAVVRLSQAPHNKIYRLRNILSIGALLPSLPPAFLYDKALEQGLINILSAIVAQVPLYHLECLPDAAAAELSYNTLFGNED